MGDGKVVEIGGQSIGPTQTRIAALAAELGVDTFPTHDEGRHLVELGSRVASFTGHLADPRVELVRDLARAISPLALADLEQARARLDRMARQVPLDAPWTAPRAGGGTARRSRPGSAATPAPLPPGRSSSSPPRRSGRLSRAASPSCTSSSTPTPAVASTRWSGPVAVPSRTASTAAPSASRSSRPTSSGKSAWRLDTRCAGSSTGPTRWSSMPTAPTASRTAHGPGAARDRRDPADPGRRISSTRRCRRCAIS